MGGRDRHYKSCSKSIGKARLKRKALRRPWKTDIEGALLLLLPIMSSRVMRSDCQELVVDEVDKICCFSWLVPEVMNISNDRNSWMFQTIK